MIQHLEIHRLFALSFKNSNDDHTRNSFNKYYIPLVEIKDFNALIDNKPFFDQPVKNKQKAYEKLLEMSNKDDYTTGNLLDYLYHQKYYKLIGIDLSKQINTSIPQKVNFVGKSMMQQCPLFLKSSKSYYKISFRFIDCNRIILIMEHQKIQTILNPSKKMEHCQ